MNVLQGSLLYRLCSLVARVAAEYGRASLIGRFFVALRRAIVALCSGSFVLGLGRSGSRVVLGTDEDSLVARGVGRVWPSTVARKTALGLRSAAGASCLGSGTWLRAVGTILAGFGLGRLILALRLSELIRSQPVAISLASVGEAAVICLLGLFVAAAAPRLITGFPNGAVTGRIRRWGLLLFEGVWTPASVATVPSVGGSNGRATIPAHQRTRNVHNPLLWTVLVATAAIGVAGGLSTGSRALIVLAMGLFVGLVVLLMEKPEVVLLIVAAFPWVNWLVRRVAAGYGGGWDDAFLFFSLVLLIWGLAFLRRVRLWTVPILVPTLLCAALAVGSLLVNNVQTNVAIFAARLLLEPVLYYFIGFLFPKNRRWVQWTIGIFLVSGVLLALHGLYQYVTHAPMPYMWVASSERGIITTRAYSIIANPNGLGALLLMGALISLSFALSSGLRAAQRWGMAAVSLIHMGGIAVTFSRGAWLALAAGIVALLLINYRRYLVPLVGVGIIAYIAAPSTFTNRLRFAFSASYLQQSESFGRLYIWKVALTKAAEHPFFGVGLGTFGGTSANTYGLGDLWVDNYYLQLGAEGGLILLVAFLWLLLRTGKALIKAFLVVRDPYMKALTAGTFSGCLAVCAANVTASVWETLTVGVAFWFLAGFVTSAAHQTAEESSERTAD